MPDCTVLFSALKNRIYSGFLSLITIFIFLLIFPNRFDWKSKYFGRDLQSGGGNDYHYYLARSLTYTPVTKMFM